MKKLSDVLKERSEYKTLINAVIRRVGMDSVQDINNHGIGGGFNGFIYYKDTVAFWKAHRKDIMRFAEEMADSLGEDTISMIQNFNCLGKKDYSSTDIAKALYAGKGDVAEQIQNAMAWFAAEEVCRMFEE